jgi:hypothetical protein
MAKLVAAFGTSHSPALNSPAQDFPGHVLLPRRRSRPRSSTCWSSSATISASALARHMVEALVEQDFDVSYSNALSRQSGAIESSPQAQRVGIIASGGLSWIVVAGAAERLTTQWQEYVPLYRTPAGTGCGMAFAAWN